MLNKKNAQILSDFSAQLIKKLPHYSIQGNRESSVALSQEVREILDTLVVYKFNNTYIYFTLLCKPFFRSYRNCQELKILLFVP